MNTIEELDNFEKNINRLSRNYSKGLGSVMKYLNVAEKNDAAKNIAGFLSRGTARRREGFSQYNKIYEFDGSVFNQNVKMLMTSVSGHLLNYEFVSTVRAWASCNPVSLFDAPVLKSCLKDYEPIKRTLEREIQFCQTLIIWTDCDREGENIGFEIIKVCQNVKPNIRIYRAKFSEITAASVFRALTNLEEPNKNISDAVDVRQEMDLRTGAAFTRLQTLHLKQVFPQKLSDKLISYGSCQFPTLGFVVERFKDIENFIAEAFWRLKMAHTKNDLTVEFQWDRDRLFAKTPCQSLLEICQENPLAAVVSVISKPKNKWRPVPLDTVEMEKTISRKLKINAKETMRIAERLYTQGFISYPRTETNIFPKELNLTELVEQQSVDQRWGEFANRVLRDGGANPRQGKKSDQAHPPIHPTKHAPNLTGNEQRVYEYIVRHFLACVSKDAVGHETIIKVNIAGEGFTAKGLIILERNYLDVYIYEKWTAKEVHNYRQGETFAPSVLEMAEGSTTAPKLLTEADLIALMEKNGIGTDATHADHIDTIKSREYVGLHENVYFVPGTLGMGLVEGYDNIGLEVSLAKPTLRAAFESDLKLICDGLKDPQVVLREQIEKYRAMFNNVVQRIQQIEEKLEQRINEQRVTVQNSIQSTPVEQFKSVLKCPKCDNSMYIKKRKDQDSFYLACVGFPSCKNAVWFPGFFENVDTLDEVCEMCGPDVKKLKVKFRAGQNPFFGENPKVLCIGGCDMNVIENLDIALSSVMKTNQSTTNNGQNSNLPQTTNNRGRSNSTSNSTPNRANSTSNRGASSRSNSTSTRSTNNRGRNTNNGNSNNRNNGANPGSRNNIGVSQNNWNQLSQSTTNVTNNRNVANNTPQPNTSTNNTQDNNDWQPNIPVTCYCNLPAIHLTVKKDGPNKGKQFYKCESGGCHYFLWASVDTDAQPPNNNLPPISSGVQCNCGQTAIQRTVQKDGPNKGKQFYTCPGPMDSKCNFFKWADDMNDGNASGANNSFTFNNSQSNNWNAGRGRGRGGNRGHKRKAPSNSNQGGKTRRKCGLCGVEGHIRTNCPNS